MRGEKCPVTGNVQTTETKSGMLSRWQKVVGRRSFLHGIGGLTAAGSALPSARLFADDNKLSKGDAALLLQPSSLRPTCGSNTTNWVAR